MDQNLKIYNSSEVYLSSYNGWRVKASKQLITGIIDSSDRLTYVKDGVRHREDGPAIEFKDGSKAWYVNNKLHRIDGPAIEWGDGGKAWFIDDKHYDEDTFRQEIHKRGLITPDYFKNML